MCRLPSTWMARSAYFSTRNHLKCKIHIKHIIKFLPQGNISPGTKLEEGKGNAASGDDSSLLRAMMMWSHGAQTSYSQTIDMFLFIFTQQGPTVRWTCSKRKTSSALVTWQPSSTPPTRTKCQRCIFFSQNVCVNFNLYIPDKCIAKDNKSMRQVQQLFV